jgi:hypothetical protein
MKCCSPRLGLARRLLALSVSFAVVVSSYAFAIATPSNQSRFENKESQLQLTSVTATATEAGVLLRWTTNPVADNLGFNIYRLKDGKRTRVNQEIIPGSLFGPGTPAQMPAGYSYGWFDRGGSSDTTYLIESVSIDGSVRMHNAVIPVAGKTVSDFAQAPVALSPTDSLNVFEKRYPTEAANQPSVAVGPIESQWAIAAKTTLKIAITKEGWYRVTQPQMVAAGFNPVVDIRNLRLFVDANEVAINTSQLTGTFGSSDYIEFYGTGLDTTTTDKHIYYLVADTVPGKRVIGGIQLDGDGPPPPPSDPPGPRPTPTPELPATTPVAPFAKPVLQYRIFYSDLMSSLDLANGPGESSPAVMTAPKATSDVQVAPVQAAAPNIVVPFVQPNFQASNQRRKSLRAGKRAKKRKVRVERKQEYSHALVAAPASSLPNFNYTIQYKEKFLYFSSLLNGDADNFFGRAISTSVNTNLNVTNPDLAAAAPASVEFALQGVLNSSGSFHDVGVSFNGVPIGSLSFSPLERAVRTFPVPIALLQSGNNVLTFTRTSTGAQDLSLIEYVRLTYPHVYKADTNSLKFNLRGTQTVNVDGFSTPTVRLIDYTDPLNVSLRKPASAPTALGYAITVPVSESRSKSQRLLYAFPQGQFDQAAALSVSQPSNLNLGDLTPAITNGANFLVIAHKNFIASMAPLINQRLSQGKIAAVVDVDDVYDEFSYGVHGPQAIKDFIGYTLTSAQWVNKPSYVIFAGDATLDPRNYRGQGDLDYVPTKLVDATYNETVSDDWLADFSDGSGGGPDGIADVSIGRFPFGSVADMDLVVSKIVNFTPQPQPQTAMMVADEDAFNIYGFAETNDAFQSLLPANMSVLRLNRAPQPPGVPSQNVVKADIVNGFNAGPALVSYAGHGNIDVWTGASLFLSNDALALTNGNHLPFVVVMDCLNGYFQEPAVLSLSEAWLKAPNGGGVAAFASSGLTIAQGQHLMGHELYTQLYSGAPMALGDAIRIAKASTFDEDVKRTWIFFGDPSIKIR